MTDKHTGQCYCGQVKIAVSGQPGMQGLCHCASCRAWQGAPFIAFTGYPSEAVTITGQTVQSHHRSESGRTSCASCGGVVANIKPAWDVTVIYPTLMRDMPFEPAVHLHYGERLLDMADGLPKFVNAPERIGGTGEMAAEPSAIRYL